MIEKSQTYMILNNIVQNKKRNICKENVDNRD